MAYTDAELAKMDKQLNKIYKQAQDELQVKWNDYMKKAQLKADKAQNAYLKALSDGDPAAATAAKDAYEKVLLNQTLQNKHYQDMVDQLTTKLADTNQQALTYLNGEMPKVYCQSFNAFADEHIKGYSFEMVDESTVEYLVKNGNKTLLPQKQLNIPKDKKWNTKIINGQVLQGILQGESIPKISARLFPEIEAKAGPEGILKKNKEAAVRNARTMVTGAENKGRMDSYVKAQNDGVILKKVWVSHHSERTRDWHADLGGVEKDINEPFENDYGEIMYPGDPTAHPANVYNCRCSIKTKILGFKPLGKPTPYTPEPEKVTGAYVSVYQGVSVTAQYYSMLNENKAIGNEFWKALNAEGKPSAVWKDYLAGNTSKEVTTKLDDILAKYKGTGQPIKPGKAKIAAVVEPPKPKPDLGMYQDKSMTATYYSVKAEDKALGKQFWEVIQTSPNPSMTWNQYLIGVAPQDITEKLDKILLQHKGTGAWSKPVGAKAAAKKAAKAADAGDDLLKYKKDLPENLIDVKNITFSQDEDTWENIKGIIEASKTDEKTLAQYWYKYVKGEVKNSKLDKLLTPELKKMAEADDLLKAKTDDLLKAKAELAVAQGNLDSLTTKAYTGIWKEPVTLADYEAKAGAIKAKKDYFYTEIEKLDHKLDNDEISELFYKSKVKQFEQHIDDLIDFENKGKLYVQYNAEYTAALDKVRKLTPVGDQFGPEAFTQARKDAALWAKNYKQYESLDDYYDKLAKKVHSTRTSIEKDGYYHYTWGSGPFNSPLAGFEHGFNTSGYGFKGPGKVNINIDGYGDKIKGLTSLVEKSKYDKDFWVQSGQYHETLEGVLNLPYGTLKNMTEAELQQFVGLEREIPQFISGAINKGGGSYTPGNMVFNIYCPSGSEALYVREDGHFGKSEHEMILQRGGTYKITKIYWGQDVENGGTKLMVDLELHPERGYNKFQQ